MGEVLDGSPAPRVYCIGLLHPAFVSRGMWRHSPAQVEYLRRAAALAGAIEELGPEGALEQALAAGLAAGGPRRNVAQEHRTPPLFDVSSPPPGACSRPATLDEMDEWLAGPVREGVAVDVEAAGPHIRAVGFIRLADLRSVQVHFRRKGGGLYWKDTRQLAQAVEFVDRMLGDPTIPKVLHAGMGYDLPQQLERVGWRVKGYAMDTMLAAHVAGPECPKGLQWLATFLLGVPVWKDQVEADEEVGDGKQ